MDFNEIAETFHRNGFALTRQLFSLQEIAEIENQLDEYIRTIVPDLQAGDVYYEASPARSIKSLIRLEKYSPFFDDLTRDARLTAPLRAIWPEGEMDCQTAMYFGKPARDGSEVPPHQDNGFQCWDPALALTVTIAVDESVPENGALVCQAGSHQIGLLPHRQSGIQGFSRCLVDPVDTASYPEVQLCMQPGDICLHHINTVHRSGANELDRPRRQLGLLYRSSLAQRDTEAWDQYHKDLNLLHKSTQSS